jgi:hypothetical protein
MPTVAELDRLSARECRVSDGRGTPAEQARDDLRRHAQTAHDPAWELAARHRAGGQQALPPGGPGTTPWSGVDVVPGRWSQPPAFSEPPGSFFAVAVTGAAPVALTSTVTWRAAVDVA